MKTVAENTGFMLLYCNAIHLTSILERDKNRCCSIRIIYSWHLSLVRRWATTFSTISSFQRVVLQMATLRLIQKASSLKIMKALITTWVSPSDKQALQSPYLWRLAQAKDIHCESCIFSYQATLCWLCYLFSSLPPPPPLFCLFF